MRQYCLSPEELSRIIDIEIGHSTLYDDERELSTILDEWHTWDLELICFSVFLSYVLKQKQRQSVDAITLLQDIYKTLDKNGLLIFEQVDEHFVGYMLKCVRHREISINDELIDIRNQLSEYDYHFK